MVLGDKFGFLFKRLNLFGIPFLNFLVQTSQEVINFELPDPKIICLSLYLRMKLAHPLELLSRFRLVQVVVVFSVLVGERGFDCCLDALFGLNLEVDLVPNEYRLAVKCFDSDDVRRVEGFLAVIFGRLLVLTRVVDVEVFLVVAGVADCYLGRAEGLPDVELEVLKRLRNDVDLHGSVSSQDSEVRCVCNHA